MSARADLATALGALTLSGAYVSWAGQIEDSLLADAVGAAGVPTGVGCVMMLASAVLLLKAAWRLRREQPAATPDAEAPDGRAHRLAAGLLALLLVYVALLPLVGYVIALSALVVAIAFYAGGRERTTLIALAVTVGPLLWLIFDVLLQVRMPRGLWSTWLGG